MDGYEIPLTWAQYWPWVAQHETPIPAPLTGHIAVPIPTGGVSVSDVEGAVRWIVRRHEALRTKFRTNADGYPVQVIGEDADPVVKVIDSPTVLREQDEEEALGPIRRPFELGEELPIRAAILTVNGIPETLHVVVHHIVCDNTSAEIIKSEIGNYLEHAVTGDVPRLPVPQWTPRQQHEFESSPRGKDLNRRALQYLRGIQERQPYDVHAIPYKNPLEGGCRVRFGSDELGRLCEVISKREGCFDTAVLVTAFAASFANAKGRDVSLFSPLFSNRHFPNTKGYVSNLVEMGRLLVDFGRFPAFRDALKDVMLSTVKGMRYGIYDPNLGIERVADGITVEGPLFNYVPTSSNTTAWPRSQAEKVETTEYPHQVGNSIFVIRDQGRLNITMHADRDFLSPQQATYLVAQLPVLLEQFWREPEVTRLDFEGVLPRWTAPKGWIDWRGCWIHKPDLKAVLEAFPGVREAHVPTGASKGRIDHLVVGVVATRAVTPTALREHLLNTRWPSGASVVPAEIVVREDAPHDTDSVEAWCVEPGFMRRGTGREEGTENDGTGESPAEAALLRSIRRLHPGTYPRLSANYAEARGEYIKIPAVLAGVREAGYRGLTVQDLTSPCSLRRLAGKLAPRS
jgi:hypothetical protein